MPVRVLPLHLLTQLAQSVDVNDPCSLRNSFSSASKLVPYVFPTLKSANPLTRATAGNSSSSLVQLRRAKITNVEDFAVYQQSESGDVFPEPPAWSWTSTYLQRMQINASKQCNVNDNPLLFVRQTRVPVLSTPQGSDFLENAVQRSKLCAILVLSSGSINCCHYYSFCCNYQFYIF